VRYVQFTNTSPFRTDGKTNSAAMITPGFAPIRASEDLVERKAICGNRFGEGLPTSAPQRRRSQQTNR
jgi:hypothetical protein